MLQTPTQKRLEKRGWREYTTDETLVYVYVTIYGFSDLYIRSVEDLSKVLNRSFGSLYQQMLNVKYLLGKNQSYYDCSKTQREVFEFIKGESEYEIRQIVKDIINDDQYKRRLSFDRMRKNYDRFKLIGKR
jgi:hypothetical protein